MKLYLASPLGFSEAGRYFYTNQMIPAIVQLGYTVIDPWSLADQSVIKAIISLEPSQAKIDQWRAFNLRTGATNMEAIHSSDALVAVLDGADIDSGTASEVGFASALGKPVFGYRGDFRLSADNEGGIVNLQVEFFIRHSGGDICTDFPTLLQTLATHINSHNGVC